MKKKEAIYRLNKDKERIPMNRAARREVKHRTGRMPAPIIQPFHLKDAK